MTDIKKQISELQRAIDLCIYGDNVEKYKYLFTNDFSFWLFKQCINETRYYLNCNKSILSKLFDQSLHNRFFVVNQYLFGVNDDGKIFCIVGISSEYESIYNIYHIFGYDYDIVDNFSTIFDNNNNTIKMEIKNQDLLKIRDDSRIRVAGDLIMIIDNNPTIKIGLCDAFRTYMHQLISNELAKLGIITEENWYIPYPKYCKNEIDKHFKILVNIFQNVLQRCGFEITHQIINEFCSSYYFNFGGIDWLAEIQYNESNGVISYKIVSTKGLDYLHYVEQISNEKLLMDVLQFIGINTEEQTIVAHVGNHKIIIHGYNLSVIKIGNREIVFNSFIAKKVICEHPEHLTVEITFDDYQLVDFNLIPMPREHQTARNTYLAEKLSQHGKI